MSSVNLLRLQLIIFIFPLKLNVSTVIYPTGLPFSVSKMEQTSRKVENKLKTHEEEKQNTTLCFAFRRTWREKSDNLKQMLTNVSISNTRENERNQISFCSLRSTQSRVLRRISCGQSEAVSSEVASNGPEPTTVEETPLNKDSLKTQGVFYRKHHNKLIFICFNFHFRHSFCSVCLLFSFRREEFP